MYYKKKKLFVFLSLWIVLSMGLINAQTDTMSKELKSPVGLLKSKVHDEQRKKYDEQLKKYQEADINKDGKITFEEIIDYRKKIGTPIGIEAVYTDVKYGAHSQNAFDIWLAKSKQPTPLVIFIHGGGFEKGDKTNIKPLYMVALLDSGISVASINYRFYNQDSLGILGCLKDSKYCLQFIRYHSKKYNIDKKRIACYGKSAGAGTSLWLAFHDEMADATSTDPVLRESTRLACAGALNTQSTYDRDRWSNIIGLNKSDSARLMYVDRKFVFRGEKGKTIRAELDFLEQMSADDPPIFIYNEQVGGVPMIGVPVKEANSRIGHHPLHAKKLKEKADQVGIEAIAYAPQIGLVDPSGETLVSFMARILLHYSKH